MALDRIIRSAVAIADKVTKPLQSVVSHDAWVSQAVDGAATYAAVPVNIRAIAEKRQFLLKTSSGRELVSSHRLLILESVAANGAAGRHEPIDERDRFTLSDGAVCDVLMVEGPFDAASATGETFIYVVWLGPKGLAR